MRKEYFALMQDRPALFDNPSDCPLKIIMEEAEIQNVEQKTGRTVGIMYEDSYIYLLRDAVKFANGSFGTYIRLVHKNASGGSVVLPVTEDGKLILVKHFRHSARKFYYEIPRGFQEAGLTGKENAKKEIKEEINAVPLDIHYLGDVLADSGLIGTSAAIYCATIPAENLQVNDMEEGITHIISLSYDELVKKILEGEIQDSYTLTALYLAKLHQLI